MWSSGRGLQELRRQRAKTANGASAGDAGRSRGLWRTRAGHAATAERVDEHVRAGVLRFGSKRIQGYARLSIPGRAWPSTADRGSRSENGDDEGGCHCLFGQQRPGAAQAQSRLSRGSVGAQWSDSSRTGLPTQTHQASSLATSALFCRLFLAMASRAAEAATCVADARPDGFG